MDIKTSVLKRFLRYVSFDTQSDEESTTYPSTEKQKILGETLVKELKDLGLNDAAMDQYGYVIATLKSNTQTKVPVIGFLAHMDTSPDASGKNVKPQVHENYKGGPLKLNDNYTLTPEQSAELLNCKGNTIITSDGTTLLGADDKAGIAEIMTMVEYFVNNKDIKHGDLKIGFTVDEEVGRGTKYFDVKKFGAKYAYTVDGGGEPGVIENESFSADAATVTFEGYNVHPGYAKDKLINSMKAAGSFLAKLPRELSPEKTEGLQGFIHPVFLSGEVEKTTVKLILRSFKEDELITQQKLIDGICKEVVEDYTGVKFKTEYKESYRNMRNVLDKHPEVVDYAMEAVKRLDLKPKTESIRGGTDGSTLSFMGLPTANIFAGGVLFHSRFEWVSLEVMELAVKTLINIVQIWEEKTAG